MTCGDLSDEPQPFDLKLHEAFSRGINWGAIVFLDEEKEYVYSRDRHIEKRNYLTPILLRHLETSKNLTIVTVTHPKNTEKAFMGHMQLSLRLPDISFENQKVLWRKAIESVPW